MNLGHLLGILVLVVALPLNVYVTIRVARLSRRSPDIAVLRERAVVSLALTIIVAIFGIVFVNNDLSEPFLSGDATRLITRGVVLIWSVIPAGYLLWVYHR